MRRAEWCHCGIFWLLDWQNSHLEEAIHHTREHCLAVNFTT